MTAARDIAYGWATMCRWLASRVISHWGPLYRLQFNNVVSRLPPETRMSAFEDADAMRQFVDASSVIGSQATSVCRCLAISAVQPACAGGECGMKSGPSGRSRTPGRKR